MKIVGIVVQFVLIVLCGCNDLQVLHNFSEQLEGKDASLQSWNLSHPCSSWKGVTCLNDGQTVVNLTLPNKSLKGIIPSMLGQLYSLQYLDLSKNFLRGRIPAELHNCTKLVHLALQENNISGTVPAALGEFHHLQYLNLNENRLHGCIPAEIGNCSKLNYLDINTNYITGVPTSLSWLATLQKFSLHENNLTGPFPQEILNLTNLQVLSLSNNRLIGQVPQDIGRRLYNLQELYLADNSFTGTIPQSLGTCQNLQHLKLQNNQFVGHVPNLFSMLNNLQVIRLDQNKLTGGIPAKVWKLTQLQDFIFSNNEFTGEIPGDISASLQRISGANNKLSGGLPDFRYCTKMFLLNLRNNSLTGEIPSSLGELPNLQRVWLEYNNLRGRIPTEFGKHSNLEILYLSDNRLNGFIPPNLCVKGVLARVYLHNNNLQGGIPSELFKCPALERLLLHNNKLSGVIPETGQSAAALSYLDLSHNMLTGPIPPSLENFKNLSALLLADNMLSGPLPPHLSQVLKLNVSHNRLSGNIPPELGASQMSSLDLSHNFFQGPLIVKIQRWEKLQWLYCQVNQLSGHLPAFSGDSYKNLLELKLGGNSFNGEISITLGELSSLTTLDLSSNQLSGKIPPQLGRLAMLESLDLSYNQLSGEIPSQLGSLESLVHLNLSYNHLTGSIPSTWSSRFSKSSFLGQLLCPISCSKSHVSKRPTRATVGAIAGSTVLFFLCIIAAAGWWIRNSKSKILGETFCKGVSLQAILKATDGLNVAYLVGEGGYGLVFKAVLESGCQLAIKKLKVVEDRSNSSFMQEWKSAGRIRHRNVQRILAHYCHGGADLLVYDYMPNGSLGKVLHGDQKKNISWTTRYRIALGTANGLAYLHSDCVPKIIHRDIKANNILLDSNMEPLIADFGLAKLVEKQAESSSMSYVAGSYGYIAPEYAYTLKVDERSDIYSFGVVLLELLLRKSPVDPLFHGGVDMVSWVKENLSRGSLESMVDLEAWEGATNDEKRQMELVLKIALFCTRSNPVERPGMRQVVEMLTQLQNQKQEILES